LQDAATSRVDVESKIQEGEIELMVAIKEKTDLGDKIKRSEDAYGKLIEENARLIAEIA
jgi:DNA repair exonuclease SbcCD ATPase subunit